MNQLSSPAGHQPLPLFPPQAAIQQLALNDSGFVFDPVNGRSFTANATGLRILRLLQRNDDMEVLLQALLQEYDVSRSEVERDIAEFAAVLRQALA